MRDRFVKAVLHRPKIWIVLGVVLSLLAGTGVTRIQVDDSFDRILPQDLASVEVWREIEATFGTTEGIVLAIGRPGRSVYSADVLQTTETLRRELEELEGVASATAVTNGMTLERSWTGLSPVPLVDLERLDEAGYLDTVRSAVSSNRLLRGLVSEDEAYTLLIVNLKPSADESQASRAIQETAQAYEGEYEVHLTGTPFIRGIMTQEVRSDVLTLIRVVILVLFGVVLLSLRSLRGALFTMAVIVLTVIPTIGLMGWSGSKFSIVNTSMPVVLLAIASADSIHIITHFMRKVREGAAARQAAEETVRELMLPVFLTSVTTGLAFLSLVTSPITALSPYGLFTAFGVVWAWILSVTLLPALLSISRWRIKPLRASKPAGGVWSGLGLALKAVRRRSGLVLAFTLVALALSVYGITLLEVEVNLTSFFPEGNVIRQASDFMDERFQAGSNLAILVKGEIDDPDVLRSIADIQDFVEAQDGVGRSVSIVDPIRMAVQSVMGSNASFDQLPLTPQIVERIFTQLAQSDNGPDLSHLVTENRDRALINVQMRSLSTDRINRLVGELEEYLKTEHPELDATPTGFAMFVRELVPLVVRSSVMSVVISLVIMLVISVAALRSWKLGFLTVLPLGVTVVLTFGIMGLTGIALSHVNALMSAIAIGVGVDYAIHYVTGYQRKTKTNRVAQGEIGKSTGTPATAPVDAAIDEVGPPVLLNAAAVGGGFLVLVLSRFIPIQFLGGLVSFSMLSCAFGALVLIPAVLRIIKNERWPGTLSGEHRL